MEKQTAVEYLFEQLWEEPKDKLTWHTILNKAKAKDIAHNRLMFYYGCRLGREGKDKFEQIYKETFKIQ